MCVLRRCATVCGYAEVEYHRRLHSVYFALYALICLIEVFIFHETFLDAHAAVGRVHEACAVRIMVPHILEHFITGCCYAGFLYYYNAHDYAASCCLWNVVLLVK